MKYQDGVNNIKTVTFNPLAVAGNSLLIAAVTGKRIFVLGGSVFSNGLTTILSFREATAGTVVKYLQVPANTVANPNIPLLATDGDVIQTAVSGGLYCDNSAVAVLLTINYIEYTP